MGQNNSHNKSQATGFEHLGATDAHNPVVKKRKFLRRKSHDDASRRANKIAKTTKAVSSPAVSAPTKSSDSVEQATSKSMRRVNSVRDFLNTQSKSLTDS